MELAKILQYIYLLVVAFFTIEQYNSYKNRIFDYNGSAINVNDLTGLFLTVSFTLIIGLRPTDQLCFADSYWYNKNYNTYGGAPFFFDRNAVNLIWDNLFDFWCSYRLGMKSLFLLSDILYFGCTYLACRKWFPNDTLISYLVFLGAFSTFSYSYNGIKAGIAASVFILGLAYYENKFVSLILVLISWGFHHSMQLPVAAYVLTLFFKNPKLYFYAWIFCVLMAFAHIGVFANLFAGMTDKDGASYLFGEGNGTSDGTRGGFRLDFILYSAVPVWIGYNILIRDDLVLSKTYKTLLNMYLCTNGVWCLCMYSNFTNRIAYLSWFMYPFVLIYPFLKEDIGSSLFLKGENQYGVFAKVILYHLLFTLFLLLIYDLIF